MDRSSTNYSIKQEFSLKNVIEFARKNSSQKSPKASKILNALIEKSKKDYLNFCYTYLRWVDDVVDQPNLHLSYKEQFIEHQKKLISEFYKENISVQPDSLEEACLFYFAEFAKKSNNIILLDEVKNMVHALDMDVKRLKCDGVFSNHDLECYINLMSKSLFNILFSFLNSEGNKSTNGVYLGRFTANTQMMRDLEEDIAAGFINISREDINSYNLKLDNLKEDKNFSKWLSAKIESIFTILYEETSLLKYFPLKTRLFSYYTLIYYLPNIIRIKVNDYNMKILANRTFFKEIRTYILYFYESIKIFVKGFIYSPVSSPSMQQIYTEKKLSLSLQEVFKICNSFTRKRAPKLWIITSLTMSRERRLYIYICHTYLRWVDDFIDSTQNDIEKKRKFITRQLELMDILYRREKAEFNCNEELFLFYSVKYFLSLNNTYFLRDLRDFSNHFRWDVDRLEYNNGIFSKDELLKYIEQGRNFFNIINYFLIPPQKNITNGKFIGKFSWYVIAARDLFEDLKIGYINICKEEIEKYNLNIKDLKNDRRRFVWMKDKHSEYMELMFEEISILKSMPFRIKLFWGPSFTNVITEFIRIKIYDYDFGVKYKKTFGRELKVYSQSFLLNVKLYYRVFF